MGDKAQIQTKGIRDLPAPIRDATLRSIGKTLEQVEQEERELVEALPGIVKGAGWGDDQGLGWPDDHPVGRVECRKE